MSDDRHLLDRPAGISRFDLSVRHCPKCGWAGPVSDVTLRYCGPAQRVEEDWHGSFLRLDGGGSHCDGDGEHFHWRCACCHYRRLLPVPDMQGSGLN